MKTIKKIVDKTSKELVTKMVAHDESGWPPICTSFVYQPLRPRSQEASTPKALNLEEKMDLNN